MVNRQATNYMNQFRRDELITRLLRRIKQIVNIDLLNISQINNKTTVLFQTFCLNYPIIIVTPIVGINWFLQKISALGGEGQDNVNISCWDIMASDHNG